MKRLDSKEPGRFFYSGRLGLLGRNAGLIPYCVLVVKVNVVLLRPFLFRLYIYITLCHVYRCTIVERSLHGCETINVIRQTDNYAKAALLDGGSCCL